MNLPEAKAKYNRNRLPVSLNLRLNSEMTRKSKDVISLLSEIRHLIFMYRPLSTALHCQMSEGVLPALLKEMML